MNRICYRIAVITLAVFVTGLLPAAARPADAAAPVTLKVALLPIFDVLPFYVAAQQGYFDKKGFKIEALPVGSAVERDQLIQAGAADGAVNEMISVANFNRERPTAMVVGTARKSMPGAPLFRILAAPGSGIRRPGDLAGVPIGVAMNTIIAYVTDRLLTDQGLAMDQIKKQSVPVIPERFQLLIQGQLRAAVIPDPLAASAIMAGAVEVMNDEAYPRYSNSVITFTLSAIDTRPEAVRLFLAGWYRAAADINRAPEAWRGLVLKHVRVPKNLEQRFEVPPFPLAEVPAEAQWNDVIDWMQTTGLLNRAMSYDSGVTAAFLPGQ